MNEKLVPAESPAGLPRDDHQQARGNWERARPLVIKLAVEEILKHNLHVREDTVGRVLEDIARPSQGRGIAADHYGDYRAFMPAEESHTLMLSILEAAQRQVGGGVTPDRH